MSAEDDIREVLNTYERAVNTSDAALAAGCYTRDGVFLPATLPTVRGAGMREAYAGLFGAMELRIAFTVDELVVASDAVAYALTHSNGTQTPRATGVEGVESNREVFIFGREDGAWKIARYMFNTPQ